VLLTKSGPDGPSAHCRVTMRFCRPPPELMRYFASLYHLQVDLPPGEVVSDYLHPEWGNLRFHNGPVVAAHIKPGSRIAETSFSATGPSAHATRFSLRASRIWGIGLLPAGWAKFMRVPADTMADVVSDGWQNPAFELFRPLAGTVFGTGPEVDIDAEFARIIDWFMARIDRPLPAEDRIIAIHEALFDTEIATVSALADRVGLSASTVERICRAAFGFSPKLLLRRQRFARSLARYMLAGDATWVDSLDDAYHDQAQFVREFRAFMGMTPRAYAALDHPILDAFVRERERLAKAPLQALVAPSGFNPQA